MPHFGLIEENLSDLDTLLQRSRLHIRCGKRRLLENKIQAGIPTLYDALDAALKWYIKLNKSEYVQNNNYNVEGNSTTDLFNILETEGDITETGIADFFLRFNSLLDLVLEDKEVFLDTYNFLEEYDRLLILLGVMPFNEEELPLEDPKTF